MVAALDNAGPTDFRTLDLSGPAAMARARLIIFCQTLPPSLDSLITSARLADI